MSNAFSACEVIQTQKENMEFSFIKMLAFDRNAIIHISMEVKVKINDWGRQDLPSKGK